MRLVVVATLALACGLWVDQQVTSASRTTAALGRTEEVAVMRRSLDAGSVIGTDDVELVERPVAHVPDGAVRADPAGRTARAPLGAGEIVTAPRVSGLDRDGPSALVPEGWRALAIPVIDQPVPARTGDLVDVLASFDPSLVGTGEASRTVAADAVVVDVSDDAVTVAVPRTSATDVAFALTNGIVTLALVG